MELKEIEEIIEPCTPFDIATWCKTAANHSGGLSISQAVRIMNMIEAYGNSRHNAAIDKAAEKVRNMPTSDWEHEVEQGNIPQLAGVAVGRKYSALSILNLKIPTK